jgi:hypothetical protein
MEIVSRVRAIVLRPKEEWPVIDAEAASVGSLYAKFLIPLAALGAIARFVGMSVIGVSIPFAGRIRMPLANGLSSAAVGLVALLIGVYVWALIINALATTFGGRRDVTSALKLAVYSATPMLLASVLSVLPLMMLVQLVAAVYTLYVLYLGFPVLMKSPRERSGTYTAATVGSGIVLGMIFGGVMAAFGAGASGSGVFGLGASRAARDAAAEQAGQKIAAGMLGAAAGGTDESRKAATALIAGAVAAGQQAEAAERAAAPVAATAPAATPAEAQAAAVASAGAAAAMLGSLVSGGKAAVDVVPFQFLKGMLPASVGALQRTNATGERSNVAGIVASSAEGSYAGSNGANVTIKISDMGNASGVLALGRLAFASESESDLGFEKNVVLNGEKVHEKWVTAGSQSELNAFVGERFMMEIRGSGVDLATAEKAFSSIDVRKLPAAK